MFDSNPAGPLINPALWTLPIELYCYALILLFMLIGLRNRVAAWIAGCISAFVMFFYATHHPALFSIYPAMVRVNGGYSYYPAAFFLLGMFLFGVRQHFVLDWRLALTLAVAYLVARRTLIATPLFYIAFVYAVLWFAGCKVARGIRLRDDYSYGIYIYGFLSQQIMIHFFPAIDGYLNLVIAIPLALCFAFMSWHIIEAPALRFARMRISICRALSSGANNATV